MQKASDWAHKRYLKKELLSCRQKTIKLFISEALFSAQSNTLLLEDRN